MTFLTPVKLSNKRILQDVTISNTWSVFNKPQELTPAHAGVLMGLGLQGTNLLYFMSDFDTSLKPLTLR